MREPTDRKEDNIPITLLALYKRIDCNAKLFGMSPTEVALIKKECKIAFQHKQVLDKVEKRKREI